MGTVWQKKCESRRDENMRGTGQDKEVELKFRKKTVEYSKCVRQSEGHRLGYRFYIQALCTLELPISTTQLSEYE